MYGYVYKTTFPDNKVYIGQKKSGFFIDSYFGSGVYVKRYIKKYGKTNLKVEIIEWCENAEILNEREIFYIKKFNSLMPNGYNIAIGGNAGNTLKGKSQEELNLIHQYLSKIRKGVPNPKNRVPCSASKKEKISQNLHNYFNSLDKETRCLIYGKHNKGRKQTQEEIEKRANSLKGTKKPNSFKIAMSKIHKGKIVSSETRQKQRKARLGKSPSNKNKCCINKNGKIKYIDRQELENFIKIGWKLGRK